MVPKSIVAFLKDELQIDIASTKMLSGGSINEAVKVEAGEGEYFLKWNSTSPKDFFEKEAEGLKRLKNAGSGIRIPEVIAAEQPESNRPGFLLMEFISAGSGGDAHLFGEQLAALHKSKEEAFGLDHDNFIGILPQSNRRHDTWISFFSEERISPQLKMAYDSGKLDRASEKGWKGLRSRLDSMMPPAKPSLLHGDLWGGNYLFDRQGRAVLIDPAIYYGHPEMDLAFSKMFGGFDRKFYEGYRSVSPQEPGFSDRMPVYNLYPLLVHVNLFGGHYTSQAARLLKKYGS